jgi:outer membrane protein assembly factor BamB
MVPPRALVLSLALLLAPLASAGRPHPGAAGAAAPAAEVPACGGDPARTGRMPGPGPEGRPVLRWAVAARATLFSPTLAGGLVYGAGSGGGLVALDAASGAERWRAAGVRPAAGGCAPVAGGVVYVGGSGGVHALDAATGRERWRFPPDEARFLVASSPVAAGGAIYVGVFEPRQDPALEAEHEGAVYALDAAGGAVRWRSSTGALAAQEVAVAGGTVYVGTIDIQGRASDRGALVALEAATGRQRWRFGPGDRAGLGPPAVAGGVVYVGGGAAPDLAEGRGLLYALDAATGAERWRADLAPRWSARPAVVDGMLYAGAGDGAVHALDAATGAERWRAAAEVLASAPAVVDGVVYVGGADGALYAFDGADGTERWRLALGTEGLGGGATPAVAGGVVFVATLEGLYAVGGEAATVGTPAP